MSPEPTPATATAPVERPDLKQKSVLFATVKGVGIGAIIGAISTLALGAVGEVLNKTSEWTKCLDFKGVIKEHMARDTATWAAILGLLSWGRTAIVNGEREKVRPYVEKLERERESLVQDVIKNNSR